MAVTVQEERVSAEEYVAFLKRTDLGAQYPKERFGTRIRTLVQNADISLTAREGDGTLVGVCFGVTDFAYWLFITDLGVDRSCTGQGIGRRLMELAHERAGGEKDIAVYLCANPKAVPFYEKLGMRPAKGMMEYNHVEWTPFRVE